MPKNPKEVVLLVTGIFLLIVLFQNTQVVSFTILFWTFSMSRVILLPLVLLTGFAIGFIVGKMFQN